jgi:hypothetical protein
MTIDSYLGLTKINKSNPSLTNTVVSMKTLLNKRNFHIFTFLIMIVWFYL